MVMKIVECNGNPVAKIPDSAGKGMCESKSFLSIMKTTFNIQDPNEMTVDEWMEKVDEMTGKGIGKCHCGKEGQEEHTCPYKSEIEDDDSLCKCCEQCTKECGEEI